MGHHGFDRGSPLLQLTQHLGKGIEGYDAKTEIAQPLRQQPGPGPYVEGGLPGDGCLAKHVVGASPQVMLDDTGWEDRVIDLGNGIEVRLLEGAGSRGHHPATSRLVTSAARPAWFSSWPTNAGGRRVLPNVLSRQPRMKPIICRPSTTALRRSPVTAEVPTRGR